MVGGTGHPVVFNFKELAMEQLPDPGLLQHVQLPPKTSNDIVTFGAKYVESRENLNRAYFANEELAQAYHTIPYKALDIEHETERVVGHIYSSAYIDRANSTALDPDELLKLAAPDLESLTIDVVIGGVVYADRFPAVEGPITRKAYSLSMETYFDTFDILLENGIRMTLDEAEALGLGEWVDQLMGSFENPQDFEQAFSLKVKVFANGDKTYQTMKAYKWLKGIMFSGGGLVLNPACPSCHILTTDRDDCACNTDASIVVPQPKTKLFEADLTIFEPYVKTIRDGGGKPTVHQVNIETGAGGDDLSMPVTGPFGVTPNLTTEKKRSQCPNFKDVSDSGDPEDPKKFWCSYASEKCPVAGDKSWKECLRWYQRGEDWLFDTRNFRDTNYSPDDIVQPDPVNPSGDETILDQPGVGSMDDKLTKQQAMDRLIESFVLYLQAAELENDTQNQNRQKELAAWTTQFINGLPNSSFAAVETGYKDGDNKNARHLPFKDGGGKVDLPHLRNALARMNQIKSVLGKDTDAELRARAKRKLTPYAKKYLKTTQFGD